MSRFGTKIEHVFISFYENINKQLTNIKQCVIIKISVFPDFQYISEKSASHKYQLFRSKELKK